LAVTWSRRFDAPIVLPDDGKITTLRQAGEYIAALPAIGHNKPHWQTAMRCLIDAAEHGGIVMLADIAVRKAFSHGLAQPGPATRTVNRRITPPTADREPARSPRDAAASRSPAGRGRSPARDRPIQPSVPERAMYPDSTDVGRKPCGG
jgi:hypothetical protein